MAEPARIRCFMEVMDDRTRDLREMLAILREIGGRHVLIGALAVGHHGRERATVDVDMIVPGRQHLKWIADTARARGYLATTTKDMVRLYPPGSDPEKDESIADFISAVADPVIQAAFNESEPVVILGEHVQVVNRGALVALKFHAISSPRRLIEDKHMDIGDVGRVIRKKFDEQDEDLARRIVALSYPGAEEDFDTFIDNLRHGRITYI